MTNRTQQAPIWIRISISNLPPDSNIRNPDVVVIFSYSTTNQPRSYFLMDVISDVARYKTTSC